MSAIPIITCWEEFRAALNTLESTRGKDFALGAEMGFGEYRNPAGEHMRRKTLDFHNNQGVRNIKVAAGLEYGELLAERAPTLFQAKAQLAYLALAQL